VVGVDRVLGRSERGVSLLDSEVGRQAARRLAQVHGAAGGVKADPEFACRPDLRAEQVARPGGEDVVVVCGRGAAAAQQRAGRGARRGVRHRLVDSPPDRVEGRQPLEQARLLGKAPGEPLVEVMVRVHEAGGEQVPGAVDVLGRHAVAESGGRAGACRRDHLILDDDVAGAELGAIGVHGGDGRVAYDDPPLGHGADSRAAAMSRQRGRAAAGGVTGQHTGR
jgi:hypothetical protein